MWSTTVNHYKFNSCFGVSLKGSRERCLPVFFWKLNGRNGKKGRKREKKGKNRNPKRQKMETEKKKRKNTEKKEENGRKRKKSEATPFQRPPVRNPDFWRNHMCNAEDLMVHPQVVLTHRNDYNLNSWQIKNVIVSVIFAKWIPLGIPNRNCNKRVFPRNCYIFRASIRLGIQKCICNCNHQEINPRKQK